MLYLVGFVLNDHKLTFIVNMRKKYIYEIENNHKNDNNC